MLRSGTAVIAVALVMAVSVFVVRDQRDVPNRPVQPATDATATNDDGTVRVEPGRNLADGEIVDITGRGFPPSTQLTLAMCEPGTTMESAIGTCDSTTLASAMTRDDGTFITHYRVHAPSVPGAAARRCETVSFCALAIAPSSLQRGPIVVVRLHFAPPGTPAPPKNRLGTLRVTPENRLNDRSSITVTGTGLVPDSLITLTLCTGQGEQARCRGLGATDVPVGSNGTFTREVVVYRQLFTGDGFVDCGEPARACFLRGFLPSTLFNDAPLSFDTSQPAPPLPSLTITATEPTRDGLQATVEGANFPSDAQLGISECALGPNAIADPLTCITPIAASTTADANGSFTISAPYARTYATPGSGSIDCTRRPCVLAWFWGEGDSPIAATPLTFP